jgi:signal peptidase II
VQPPAEEESDRPSNGSPAAGHTAAASSPLLRVGLNWWLVAAVIVVDQITKAAIRSRLLPFESMSVIPGLLDFIHVQNAGVAFGILNDAAIDGRLKAALTTALAAVALFGIGFYARHVRHHERLARAGLSLILGGAVGNLVDRLRVGYVLDFVDVYFRNWHFWAFNVADASITIGAVFVFLDLLLAAPHASHSV